MRISTIASSQRYCNVDCALSHYPESQSHGKLYILESALSVSLSPLRFFDVSEAFPLSEQRK